VSGRLTSPLGVCRRAGGPNHRRRFRHVVKLRHRRVQCIGRELRAYYASHGGWNSIGWTHNHGAGLNMFANRSWGRIQDFRHHPDGYGGEFNTIAVSSWSPTQAYLVDSVFWQAWAQGDRRFGSGRPIGQPVSGRGSCPSGYSSACLSFQKYHLGFVWMDVYTGRTAVFCPDLGDDKSVSILDLSVEASRFGQTPVPPRVDVDGIDNRITILDLSLMAQVYGQSCYR
jgi:hypothetical protein